MTTEPERTDAQLAVVLINYNNEDDTVACLDTLVDQTLDEVLTVVVDNGSDPGSFEHVRERFEFPVYLRNEENLGFTGGNNVGIEYALDAGAEYVLLLNNDTELEPTFLEDLMDAVADLPEEVGVVGPKVHTYDTGELWSAGGSVDPMTGTTAHRTGKGNRYDEPEPVDYVVGAAILVRSAVFEAVGLLDDDFFIYYEETEFCHRAREGGFDVRYVPVSGVYHKESVEYGFSRFREYYFTRNRWLFQWKTRDPVRLAAFVPYYLVRWGLLQVAYLLVVERDLKAARSTALGVLDAVRGRTGRRLG